MINSVPATRVAPSYPRDGYAPPAAAPAAYIAPTYGAASQGNTMSSFSTFLSQAFSALSAMFTKLVDWIKGLFGPKTADTLSPEDAAVAQRYSLLPTKANVDAFRAEVAQYQGNGTLGPGVQNPDAVKQLQLALARLGYQVQASGEYDQATASALTRFKLDNGLHQTYRSADGNWAVNEYATPDVVAALIEKLRQVLGQ